MADKGHSSKSHPGLEKAPGKSDNWIEKSGPGGKGGGLPSYIDRIAKHLHSDKGMTVSHAIATAVNTVKRWCTGGTVSKTKGPETSGGVSAATKAKACKAVAEWNAKKASTGVNAGMDRDAYSDEDMLLELAQQINDGGLWLDQAIVSDEEFDMDAFNLALESERADLGLDLDQEDDYEELNEFDEVTPEAIEAFDLEAYDRHLAEARVENGLELSVFKWDPRKHKRGLFGRFIEMADGMKPGDRIDLPDGESIKKLRSGRLKSNSGKTGTSREFANSDMVKGTTSNVSRIKAENGDPWSPGEHPPRDSDGKMTTGDRTERERRDEAVAGLERIQKANAKKYPPSDEPTLPRPADSDGMRYATPGERGDLEYFDTREEAEYMAEDLGGEILEIPKGDQKYRIVDERMEVSEYDTLAEVRREHGPSIDAGEVSLDEPYESDDEDTVSFKDVKPNKWYIMGDGGMDDGFEEFNTQEEADKANIFGGDVMTGDGLRDYFSEYGD